MKKSRFLILSVLFCIIACMAYAESKGNDEATRRKARYFWIEGSKQQAVGNHDAAFDLYNRAWQIDKNYEEARHSTLFYQLYNMDEADSVTLDALRQYTDLYPGDEYEANRYAYICHNSGKFEEARRIYTRLLKQNPSNTEYLLSITSALVNEGEFSAALDTLYSYQRQEGMSSELSEKMLMLCLLSEDSIRARQIMDEGVAKHPTSPDFELIKVRYFQTQNMPDSAFAAAKRAELLAPNDGDPKMMLASLYLLTDDSVMYDKKINEALLCDNFDLSRKMDIIIDYVQPLIQQGRGLENAKTLFESMIKQYPREPQVMALSASYYSMLKDWARADECMRLALDMDPENTVYWNQIIYFDYMSDNYERAEEDFNKSLQYVAEPDNDMIISLALSYSLNKQYDKALSRYEELIKKIDESLTIDSIVDNTELKNSLDYDTLLKLSNLYTMVGDVFHNQQKTEQSYIAYENALYFNPENALALNNYAYYISLTEEGDLAKAAKMSARAVAYEPENASYYDTYAWINYRMGDYANARILQQKAIELTKPETESAELYDHYGDILEKCGRHDEAVENWKKALQYEPDNETIKSKLK